LQGQRDLVPFQVALDAGFLKDWRQESLIDQGLTDAVYILSEGFAGEGRA
jgi:hypothetical protein